MIAVALALGAVPVPTFDAIFANALRQEQDKFASALPVPTMPRDTILVPFTDGENSYPTVDTDAFFTYEGGVLTLHFSLWGESDVSKRSHPTPITYWKAATVYSRLTPSGRYVASNAFGVRTAVSRYNLRTIRVAFDFQGQSSSLRKEIKLSLPPDQARRLANAAALEFRFKDPAEFSRPAGCTHVAHRATIDHPQEVDDLNCVVKAEVASIRVIRTDTGEEIASIR